MNKVGKVGDLGTFRADQSARGGRGAGRRGRGVKMNLKMVIIDTWSYLISPQGIIMPEPKGGREYNAPR